MIEELKTTIAEQQRRLRARKRRCQWFWAIRCYLGIPAVASFPILAGSVLQRSPSSFDVMTFLGSARAALVALAYAASRHHADSD